VVNASVHYYLFVTVRGVPMVITIDNFKNLILESIIYRDELPMRVAFIVHRETDYITFIVLFTPIEVVEKEVSQTSIYPIA
jgi:hypothetical protein